MCIFEIIDQPHSFLLAVAVADFLAVVGDGHGERGSHGGVHPKSLSFEGSQKSGSQHLISPTCRCAPAFLVRLVPSGLTNTSVYVTRV